MKPKSSRNEWASGSFLRSHDHPASADPHIARKLHFPFPEVFGFGVMTSTSERERSDQSRMFFGFPFRTTKTIVET